MKCGQACRLSSLTFTDIMMAAILTCTIRERNEVINRPQAMQVKGPQLQCDENSSSLLIRHSAADSSTMMSVRRHLYCVKVRNSQVHLVLSTWETAYHVYSRFTPNLVTKHTKDYVCISLIGEANKSGTYYWQSHNTFLALCSYIKLAILFLV